MSLLVIKKLGTRRDGKFTRSWSLVECPYCKKHFELRNQELKTRQSCGCATHLKSNPKHGMSSTRQYQIWADMKTRCDNPKNSHYYLYGGRNISYDTKWKTFEGFWDDMSEGYSNDLTIDRIDSNKNYYKDNCRWIPLSQQYENRNLHQTFKTRNINTYARKVRKKDIEPYVEIYKNTPHKEKRELAIKISKKLNISFNTVRSYLSQYKKGKKHVY